MQQIVTNTLAVGQGFKNYKALCNALGQQPKRGNSRDAQVKEFKRYFDWETPKGQQCVITVIYDTPREKVDGRKSNGQHPNSQKALEENRDNRRTIPVEWIYSVLGNVYADCTEQVIIVGINELRMQVGIGNSSMARLMYGKQDLGLDWEVIDAVFGNLYASMKDKVLCKGIKLDKLLVFTDGTKRLATKQEKQLIQQAEELAIVGTRFKEYSEIYRNGTRSEQQLAKQNKTKHLKQLIPNYCKDTSCFVIQRSVLDTTIDYNTAQQLKQQINTLFYEHEVTRVTKRFDDKILDVKNSRCYGSARKIKIESLLLHKDQSLELLQLALKFD